MIHRQDDTFVIDYNGMPYHLTPEAEPAEGLYAETLIRYQAEPEEFTEEYPAEPMAEEIRATEINAELAGLLAYLASTDYIALKLAEGAASADEYATELAKRQEARARINELQAEPAARAAEEEGE